MLTRIIRNSALARCRLSLARLSCTQSVSAADTKHQRGLKGSSNIGLVIFDKDGTLMCFNSLWIPWVKDMAQRFERITGVDMTTDVYRALGICTLTNRAFSGVLAEGTMAQVRNALLTMLQHRLPSTSESELHAILNDAVQTPEKTMQDRLKDSKENLIVPVTDLAQLMGQLKQLSVRTAVCTADSRASALSNLAQLGVLDTFDYILCGDDQGMPPKPNPVLVRRICEQLRVDPSHTLVVGDTKVDMLMAEAAQVALKVAVLSGVGKQSELSPIADVVVPHVGHLYPIIAARNAAKPSVQPLGKSHNPQLTQVRSYATARSRSEYDYVIVGAGSAGCVLAHRLSAANKSVCLLEAGRPNKNWKLHMPAAALMLMTSRDFNWRYQTVPQRHLDNRILNWPRGKTLGGSSSINGMVFMRGNPMDFDRWNSEENAPGWSYADVLPYFKRMEKYLPADDNPQAELMRYRGFEGPLRVTNGKHQNRTHTHIPLHEVFIEAAQQAGYSYTHDMNGHKQEGAGWFDCTIHDGKRMSTGVTYLKRAKWSNRLHVRTDSHSTRLLFDSSQSKVIGVQVASTRNPNAVESLYAAKEVLVCGGAINSPQLLLLSGIGNADALKKVGITPVHHLPGVGQNLQDHIELYVQFGCQNKKHSLHSAQWHTNPFKMVNIGTSWFLKQKGWAASSHFESGAFLRSNDTYAHANLQIHFLPAAFADMSGRQTKEPGMQMHIGGLRPFSRGQLTLRTSNPFDAPLIDPACLHDKRDVTEMVESVKIARKIFQQKAFDAHRTGEIAPGPQVRTDSEIEAFVRQASESAYHPCGTCKMGDIKKDPMAVVDPASMRVHGLDGIRVVDASVMPSETSGNLNAPTIMIAEKSSDMILGMKPAPPISVPYWKA